MTYRPNIKHLDAVVAVAFVALLGSAVLDGSNYAPAIALSTLYVTSVFLLEVVVWRRYIIPLWRREFVPVPEPLPESTWAGFAKSAEHWVYRFVVCFFFSYMTTAAPFGILSPILFLRWRLLG